MTHSFQDILSLYPLQSRNSSIAHYSLGILALGTADTLTDPKEASWMRPLSRRNFFHFHTGFGKHLSK